MNGMAAPFGKGTFSERQHAMARRMGSSADPDTVFAFLGGGGCLFTAARVKRRTDGDPTFIFVDRGYVHSGTEPESSEGKYDSYHSVGIPLARWRDLVNAVEQATKDDQD